jgi:hypothetical protein
LEKTKAELLSNEFKVAAQIYECNLSGEKIWFSKLAEQFDGKLNPAKGKLSPATVLKALRALSAWGIVKAEYGATDKDRAGRLLYITGESKSTIKEIYENFWKEQ